MKTRRASWWVWLLATAVAGGGFLLQAQTETNQASETVTNSTANAVAAEPTAASAPSAPARGRLDYSSFSIIAQRNIFNGNRSGQQITSTRSSSYQRSVRVDAFSLVGTLLSAKGPVAFFDGTDSGFRKALKTGDSIAGYRIKDILLDGVRLVEGTNEMDLRVGNGMRREDQGLWKLSTSTANYASSSTHDPTHDSSRYSSSDHSRSSRYDRGPDRRSYSRDNSSGGSSSSGSLPTAEVNEVLKRLMEQRAKENQ